MVFALAIFTGAFLLFQIQPLIGKYILPWFGGGPAVWTTCMLFFQVLLLGGYGYAHLSARWLKPRQQALLHLGLVLTALALLPITPAAHWKPSGPENPTGQILLLLAASIGMPYFVLSATGPLLQQWFSVVNPGVSPYRLYALSNAGSLLALVSYPFLFEPLLARKTQSVLWGWGLALYAVLTLACVAGLWRTRRATAPGVKVQPPEEASGPAPASAVRVLWLTLPACATVLLLAITNKMCLDVGVIPFLWVLPLGLYLLSFILCFESPAGYARPQLILALIPSLALLAYALFERRMPLLLQILIYAWTLFNACMVCHGELYRLRPHPRLLTSYYLTIATGGALGGVLVAVGAPLLFNDYLELHWGLGLLVLTLAVIHGREKSEILLGPRRIPLWRVTAACGMLLAVVLSIHSRRIAHSRVAVTRNFYGVLKVSETNRDEPARHALLLQCGHVLHGVQMFHPAWQRLPTSYYHERSGLGLALRLFPRTENRRVGVIGLGIGTIAAFGRPGDLIRFYEINPAVRRFAEERFDYLRHSTGRVEIVMGDGRLSLEREPEQNYDLLVLDAFSSDAIPTHLLTREAFEVYLRHLKPDGVIAAHISNMHLNLAPVIEQLAAHFKLGAVAVSSDPVNRPVYIFPSDWYLLSRSRECLDQPEIVVAAKDRRGAGKDLALWTDDYASLYPLLKY